MAVQPQIVSERDSIDGYVAEDVYPSTFQREFAPPWIDAMLRHKGLVPPRQGRSAFRLLDLGCGDGLGLIAMAAAHPEGEFLGIDAMAEHIEDAQATSKRIGPHQHPVPLRPLLRSGAADAAPVRLRHGAGPARLDQRGGESPARLSHRRRAASPRRHRLPRLQCDAGLARHDRLPADRAPTGGRPRGQPVRAFLGGAGAGEGDGRRRRAVVCRNG